MANELQFNFSLNYANGLVADSIPAPSPSYAVDQSAVAVFNADIATVSHTAESDMPVGAVATPGWLYLHNLDLTNFVKYGPKSAGSMVEFGRMKPGEIAWLRLAPGATLRWIADTGNCQVLHKLYND